MMPAHGFTGIFENMLKNEKIEVRLKTDEARVQPIWKTSRFC